MQKNTLHGDINEKESVYQLKNKLYPVDLPDTVRLISCDHYEKIHQLIPKETVCHYCASVLSEPCLYSSKGIRLDMKCIIQNIKIFIRMCLTCNVRYFYKEYLDGVHYGNGKILLSLDVCVYL